VRLFRPVGDNELELIARSDWRRFPPRLPEQPIFYPVLNFDYAEQIARDWNSISGPGWVGHVLEFDVSDVMGLRYPVQTAGAAALHRELWVPAEELEMFNEAIEGLIRLVATYRRGERVES
jgi:hypothetical protein